MAQKEGSPPLSTEGLRKLSKVMYYQGAQTIHTMKFRSEYERAQYLKSCWDTHFHTQDLINTTETAIKEFEGDHLMAPIVQEYAGYVNRTLWFAHQSIQTYAQRAVYIKKVKEVVSPILKVLREHKLSPLSEAKITQLADEIGVLSKAMLKYEAQAASPTARKFARVARTYGFTLQMLIRRYQTKLGFKGSFKNLGTGQQLQVLDKVTECTSGRKLMKFGKKSLEVVAKHGGNAVYALTAFAVAVDTYSADPDKRYETAVRGAVTLGSSILIWELQSLIYVEVAFALICTGNPFFIGLGIAIGVGTYFAGDIIQDFMDKNVTPVVVDFMNDHRDEVALVTFLALAPLLGPLALPLFGALSKPRSTLPSTETKPPPPISTSGLKVRGPQVPDGRVLAQQIACKA